MGARHQGLDVVRGIAILAVLLFHFRLNTGFVPVDLVTAPFAHMGWAGVDLFFVLSGYLVGGMILAEANRTGRLDIQRFFVRRAFRLWPVLLLYLATLVLVGADRTVIWSALLHVQNYRPPQDIHDHLWSLAVEEHFYLLGAFALPWLAQRGGSVVIGALAATIVTVGAMRVGALASGEALRHAQWQTQYRIDAPATGVLLAALRLYRPAIFAAVTRRRGLLLVAALTGFGSLVQVEESALLYGPGLIVAYLASAALVLAAADVAVATRWPLLARALAWLGLVSYPLYVWHGGAGLIADAACWTLGITDAPRVFAAKLAFAITVGAVMHRWIECPFLELRERHLKNNILSILHRNRNKPI